MKSVLANISQTESHRLRADSVIAAAFSMIATLIEIKNFKSIGPAGIKIPLTKVTAFVGQNSSGKSNVLAALDLFRNYKKSKINDDSFHNRNVGTPIQISITFSELGAEEQKLFRRHLSADSTLTIVQKIEQTDEGAEADDEEESNGALKQSKTAKIVVTGIEWLDEPPTTATAIKALWKQPTLVAATIDFKAWSGLGEAPPTKDAFLAKVGEFWETYWAQLPKEFVESETTPLGWANKLASHLPTVIYIQAAKRFDEEAKDTKASPFGLLLNWFVESVTADIKQAIQTKLDVVYTEALAALPKEAADDGTQVTRLELINTILNKYIPTEFGSKLEVAYQKPEVNQTIFGETGVHADDGFRSLIEHKGHGLQRSAILAIFRAYLELRSRLQDSVPALARVIFAIEEPELFLHPTVKRSTYKLFRTIADGGDQVLYATHDGSFLDVEHFHELRICRKKNEPLPPYTHIEHLSEDRMLKIWRHLCGNDNIPLESIKAHLRNAYDPLCNEGFLARKVLLVEGDTETAALPIYLRAVGFDPDEEGCAIIAVGSVELLDTFLLLFSELGIPTFVLWDGDHPGVAQLDLVADDKKDDIKNKSKRNTNLCKILEIALGAAENFVFPAQDTVTPRGCILKQTFEETFHNNLADSAAVKGLATKLYGSSSKPLCAGYYAREVVKRGKEAGDVAQYVPALVSQIAANLRALPAPLRVILPQQ